MPPPGGAVAAAATAAGAPYGHTVAGAAVIIISSSGAAEVTSTLCWRAQSQQLQVGQLFGVPRYVSVRLAEARPWMAAGGAERAGKTIAREKFYREKSLYLFFNKMKHLILK